MGCFKGLFTVLNNATLHLNGGGGGGGGTLPPKRMGL
jgi:hypothetical protein